MSSYVESEFQKIGVGFFLDAQSLIPLETAYLGFIPTAKARWNALRQISPYNNAVIRDLFVGPVQS